LPSGGAIVQGGQETGQGGQLAVEAAAVATKNGVGNHRTQRIALQILHHECVADAGVVAERLDNVVSRGREPYATHIQEVAVLLLACAPEGKGRAWMVLLMEFHHDAYPALPFFIKIDGL